MARKLKTKMESNPTHNGCDCIHCGVPSQLTLVSVLDDIDEPVCRRCADEYESRYEAGFDASRSSGWGTPQPILVF
jgi:CRISPR/Cas system-associated protein Cas10 (large subunit of type III CRISPR-Cas system)